MEEIHLKMKREYEKGNKSKSGREQNLLQVKFAKLTISRFEGTHLDWQRFWSHFGCEIDIAEFAQVAKFNYLKEMLKAKVEFQLMDYHSHQKSMRDSKTSLNANTRKIVK